jgi:hypothetical protein
MSAPKKEVRQIALTSSKGNQEKWCEDGRWYKLDLFGYEALAEVLCSHLLSKWEIPFRAVPYHMEMLTVDGKLRTGCSSPDFLLTGQSVVTAAQLLRRYIGSDYRAVMAGLPSDKQRILWLADTIRQMTGLDDFGAYLTLLFEIDTLFANDDRHLNNIAVLRTVDGGFDYCPIFDLGAALLSNTQVCRYDIAPQALLSSLRAAPFSMNFSRMMHTAQAQFGVQLHPDRSDIEDALGAVLPRLTEYYPARDRADITDRVKAVLKARIVQFR